MGGKEEGSRRGEGGQRGRRGQSGEEGGEGVEVGSFRWEALCSFFKGTL